MASDPITPKFQPDNDELSGNVLSKFPAQLASFPVTRIGSSVDEPSARWDLVLQFVAIARRRLVPGRTVWEPDAALPRRRQMPRWHFELGHVVVILVVVIHG